MSPNSRDDEDRAEIYRLWCIPVTDGIYVTSLGRSTHSDIVYDDLEAIQAQQDAGW